MKRDKDSKTQLQQLGTNEIQMGSTYIKFSTIIHLDRYHRDNVVHKVIDARDARMKVERMSNKRKVAEYDQDKNEKRNEPLSKIFKPGELNGLTNLEANSDALQEAENDHTAEVVTEGANKDTTSLEETPSAGSPMGSAGQTADKIENILSASLKRI